MPRSTIDAVGSNARCGSEVLTVNELSTTSVDEALRCVVAASAAAAQANDTSATSGNVSRHLLTGELLNWTPLLGGPPPYSTFCARARLGRGCGGVASSCSQQAAPRLPVS